MRNSRLLGWFGRAWFRRGERQQQGQRGQGIVAAGTPSDDAGNAPAEEGAAQPTEGSAPQTTSAVESVQPGTSVTDLTAMPATPERTLATVSELIAQEQRTKRESKHEISREREFRRLVEEQARRAVSDATGAYRPDIWREGIDLLKQMPIGVIPYSLGFGGSGSGSGVLLGAQWTQIGPAPLRVNTLAGLAPYAGRVLDIAIDPSGASDQTMYVASIGGIWKSTDGGATWVSKTDRLPWTQMGAVAIDPNDPSTIYAGAAYYPPGPSLFRSIDGGATWYPVGGAAMLGQFCPRIVVTSSGVVLVGTFFNGLYRSIDGGMTFGNNSPTYNNNAAILSGSIWDLHRDTQTGSTVYACVDGQGIFVSTDNGATFPTNLFSSPDAPMSGTYNCVTMAQSTQPNGKTFYASVAASPTSYAALYKSTNSGSNWSIAPGASSAAAASGQFGFNQTVGVDPQDPKHVYIGFEELWLSTDGGSSFNLASAGKVHVDHHAISFSPSSHWAGKPTRLYVGTDGGCATSSDAGANWTNLNEGVATLMVHGMDIGRRSPTNDQYSYCVTQDNGTCVRRPGMTGMDWAFADGGDAWAIAVDPADPLNVFSDVNLYYERTGDSGMTWNGGSGLPSAVGLKAVDPNNGSVVYVVGGTYSPQLYQSVDGGASFTLIHTFPAAIGCIGTVLADSNALWVGLAGGTVWKSDNVLSGATSTWTSFSSGLPSHGVSSIAVDPLDPSRVVLGVAGLSGIPAPNRSQHVYLTQNGGTTWVDASGTDGGPVLTNLPDRSVLSVALDPGSSNGLFGLGSSGSLLVAVGLQGSILSTPDGLSWTARMSDAFNTLADVTWTGSQFVAVGLGGTILTSPDGISWATRKAGPSWEALQGVASSGAIVVATSASQPQVFTSPDGVTSWTPHTGVAPHALLDIVWGGGLFVAVGYGGTIITSPDGLSWTTRTSPTTENLVTIVWSGSQYVVGGLQGALLTSPDGVTWTQRTSPTTNEINAIAWSGTSFVGVINTGEVIRSTDGITWTIQSSATSNRLLDIIWHNGMFVAVGDSGTIIVSPNGSTWTDHSFGSTPFALIAATDTTVFSSIDAGATWSVLGVGLPGSPCTALALDWMRTPSLLRVGTNGRSVFELTPIVGAHVAVLSNLAFGPISVGSSATQVAQVFNVGSVPLMVSSFTRVSGSTAFTLASPVPPLTLAPGTEADFMLVFQPTASGNATAVFQLASNDASTPTISVPMSGTGA
jgi:Abnormal spindle-like microcephaly-assoc'd, ASPM-SPD-2-Hydin